MADGCLSDKNILDKDHCVQLSSILKSFNAPINEEQSWALAYQTIKNLKLCDSCKTLYMLNGPSDLYLHKDGYVHENTFTKTNCQRRLSTSLNKLIASIGATLFLALDYGLESQEERSLDPSLERLIDLLTCTQTDEKDENEDKESNDEGIERDSPEYEINPFPDDGSSLVEQVLSLCSERLESQEQAEAHYKAVCRALVAEAMELSSFLHKITSVTAELKSNRNDPSRISVAPQASSNSSVAIDGLRLQDWARLWMQVIQELRHGVKLRKVDLTEKSSIEFELTPYEMLLDDIRSRRYKLHKVIINGSVSSKVTKDAHDLILEFIRSRPPLVPVSNRKLPPPPPKEPTLFERLLDSIRGQHKLRPTPTKPSSPSHTRLGRVRDDIKISKSAPASPINHAYQQPPHSLVTEGNRPTNRVAHQSENHSSEELEANFLNLKVNSDPCTPKDDIKSLKSPSLMCPKKKIQANLNIKVLLSIDDDDDDIIEIQYK